MKIRKATLDDIEPIMELIRRVVPLMRASGNQQWSSDYPNAAIFRRDLELDQLWVAEDGNAIVGIAAITQDQSPEYADAGWDLSEAALVVHRLATAPEARGQGIARALMLHAELIAHERRIQILRADTNSENQPMQRLFSKLGYTFAGEIGLAGRPGLRFYCYGKTL